MGKSTLEIFDFTFVDGILLMDSDKAVSLSENHFKGDFVQDALEVKELGRGRCRVGNQFRRLLLWTRQEMLMD